ncbi:MAG: polysaccharide deacetylase family protein [Bryobacteraceae bacterium]
MPAVGADGAIWAVSTLLAAAGMSYAVRGRTSTVFGPSVHCGDVRRRAVALTFDDGPTPATSMLLDLLDRYQAKATFFQCGANVDRYPGVARAVPARGHEIGNHSYSHPLLCFRSPAQVEAEIERAQATITQVTGIIPTLFRAPFGVRWFGLRQAQRRLNLLGVTWTVLGRDWKLSARAVVERVLARVHNGAIVCLHDGRAVEPAPDIGETIEAVRLLIPELRKRGFALETVSQLLCPTN